MLHILVLKRNTYLYFFKAVKKKQERRRFFYVHLPEQRIKCNAQNGPVRRRGTKAREKPEVASEGQGRTTQCATKV